MEANNMAAMSEALEFAERAICHHARHFCRSLSWEGCTINANCGDILCSHRDLCEAKTKILKALSAPLRNCDVGTAEEQVDRHNKYCQSIKDTAALYNFNLDICDDCRYCFAEWAQMPYEEGGAK